MQEDISAPPPAKFFIFVVALLIIIGFSWLSTTNSFSGNPPVTPTPSPDPLSILGAHAITEGEITITPVGQTPEYTVASPAAAPKEAKKVADVPVTPPEPTNPTNSPTPMAIPTPTPTLILPQAPTESPTPISKVTTITP